MATVVAVRHNTKLREHYEGLGARGKLFKVAMVACMRKLLIHLNALAREYDTSPASTDPEGPLSPSGG